MFRTILVYVQLSRTPGEAKINWEFFWDQGWKWQKSGVNKQADSGDNSIQKTGEIINSSVNSVSNTSEKTGLKESASRENKPNITFTFGNVELLHARQSASLTENININKQILRVKRELSVCVQNVWRQSAHKRLKSYFQRHPDDLHHCISAADWLPASIR